MTTPVRALIHLLTLLMFTEHISSINKFLIRWPTSPLFALNSLRTFGVYLSSWDINIDFNGTAEHLWNSSFILQECRSVCVNSTTDLEQAVQGSSKKLTCIFCMKREEIKVNTTVMWYYTKKDGSGTLTNIFQYYDKEFVHDGLLQGRLKWEGSKDMQDVSIRISNLTLNDSGVYVCEVKRTFFFNLYSPSVSSKINITLRVTKTASYDFTAFYSEIMMYVLLVFLTLWLLVEMIYCYRKISKSDEQAQDSATDYLAIPSENKENPVPAVTE